MAEILEFALGGAKKKEFLEEQEQIRKKAEKAAPTLAAEESKRMKDEIEFKEHLGWPKYVYSFESSPPELFYLQDFTIEHQLYSSGALNAA